MSNADFKTLIIGSGFAGTSVASMLLSEDVALVDRGGPFDIAAASSTFSYKHFEYQVGNYSPLLDAEARVMAGESRPDRADLPLSFLSGNVTSNLQGGISNWWGGYSARITPETFAIDKDVSWPITFSEIEPFYRMAEMALHVHGDPSVDDYSVIAPLPGWDYWRDYFKKLFPLARVTPQAKNISSQDSNYLGVCVGNGHCNVCANDAKARPANIFPDVNVFGETYVEEIVFKENRAVAVKTISSGESLEISFDRLVVAAGGLENVALLQRSNLPSGVRAAEIGRAYQDHTSCELLATMPMEFIYFHLGSEGAIEIPELSGYFHGVEVKTLMLIVPPSEEQIAFLLEARGDLAMNSVLIRNTLRRTARFYLQLEIPPEWGVELRTNGDQAFLYTLPYLQNCRLLDSVVLEVIKRMSDFGVEVTKTFPHYRGGFGGHHYSGTTSMGGAQGCGVVDSDQLLIGTENVYINGGSVIPRCGGAGPTLSIVALGMRLGRKLKSLDKSVL